MKLLGKTAEIIGVALYAAMFAVFILGVTMRYLVGAPLTWADEVCVILLLWSMFWSAAFVMAERDHVTFDLIYFAAGDQGRRWIAFAACLLFGALFAAAIYPTWDYIAFLWRERTSALQLSLDKVYFCFTLFVAAVALRLLGRAGVLTTRRWHDWI